MEVHHPHHLNHKKNWKEYFLEFFMLFAAVTLGFFAENVREHSIESLREKEYMTTMIEDLKEDTTRINRSALLTSVKVRGLDSLIRNIYATPYTDSSKRVLYYLYRRYMGSATDVAFSRRTISQLVGSGNLRLVKNLAISDQIVQYEIGTERILRQYSIYHDQYQQKSRDIGNKIFDSYYMLDYDRETIKNILNTNTQLSFLDDNPKQFRELANGVYGGKGVLSIYVTIINRQKELAIKIIEDLRKEYSIK
jgi:hypothetical protein